MKTYRDITFLLLLFAILAGTSVFCGAASQNDTAHFQCETGVGNIFNATAIISVNSEAYVDLENGDVVGVFDSMGDCVGQGLFTQQTNFAITIWQDDPQTGEKDGFYPGSALALKIFGERTVNVATQNPLLAYADSVYVIEGISFQDGGVIEILEQEIAVLNQQVIGLTNQNNEYQQSLDLAINAMDTLSLDLQLMTEERNVLAKKLSDIQLILDR